MGIASSVLRITTYAVFMVDTPGVSAFLTQMTVATVLLEEVRTTTITMIATNDQVVVDPKTFMWMQITIATDKIIRHSSNSNNKLTYN
jgi:hypothetical protein